MMNTTLPNIFRVEYMDNIQQTIHAVSNIYDKTSYFDTYGGSLVFCIVLLVFLAIFHMYQRMMLKAEPIRRNWAENRCSPNVIPFAGNIMRPKNMSWVEFTGKNFNGCLNTTLEKITGYFVQPIQSILGPIMKLWNSMLTALQNIRKMVAHIRTQLADIFKDFFARLMNIIPPMQRMIIALKDMLAKLQGVFKSGVYMLVGVYYSMMSFFGLLLTFVIIILIAISVLIILTFVLAWFAPWLWAVSATMILVFLSIMVPLLIMVVFFAQFGVQSPLAVPSAPSGCFGPDTPIALVGGTIVRINTLRPGAILADGGVITATMRIETGDNEVFDLNGVDVTGDHYVKHGDVWVQVKDHPDATPRPDYNAPYVFCMNTTTKHIIIGGDVFSDWDELHEPDMVAKHLSHHPANTGCSTDTTFSEVGISSDIHRQFEGGLVSDTLVSCDDGTSVSIDRVTVGYRLAGGVRVTGVVSVLGSDLRQTTSHIGSDLGGNMQTVLHGAPHNVFVDSETGKDRSTLFVKSYSHVLPPASRTILFHLITDTETFTLSNGIVMRDYTACIDFFDLVEK
jgi:hypothetical protein